MEHEDFAFNGETPSDRGMTQVEDAEMELTKELAKFSEVIGQLRSRLKRVSRQDLEKPTDMTREDVSGALEANRYSAPLASSLGDAAHRVCGNRREIEKIISYLEV